MAYRRRNNLFSTVLTLEQCEQLFNMYEGGASVKYIADSFDIHPNTVRNIYKKMKRAQVNE